MIENKKRNWMIRAGRGGYLMDEFIEKGIVAIGWNDLGKIPEQMTYEQLKNLFKDVYDEDPEGRVNQSVGQIWRFVKDFAIGDNVVSYDSSARQYYLGEIIGSYDYNEYYEYRHYRKVRWEKNYIDRDILSVDTKNTLGSILTIFELPLTVWEELKHVIGVIQSIDTEMRLLASEKQDLEQLKEDVVSKSIEFIKDIISGLSWEDTEKLVAGILKTLGYKTRFTSKGGGDLGSDIIASTDVLGLEGPLIKVEVKKKANDKISAPDIRNFLGGLRGHNKGIYVTTSGFSKEAQYEAERANFPITLIDSNWLVDLIVDNYESFDPEIKALIPLRKIYWPV